jgi:PAS domain S-box-containing protein
MAETEHNPYLVVGSSAGGIEALSRLVSTIPEGFSAPVVIAQHLDPERKSRLQEILARHSTLPVRTVTDHEILNIEYRILHAGGETRWVNERGSGIFTGDGRLLWIDGVIFDVTDRRRAGKDARRAAELDAFRVELNDALRPLTDPGEIQAQAARVLCERLQTDGAHYTLIDEERGVYRIERDFVRGDAPSMVGDYPMPALAWLFPTSLEGGHIVVSDARTSPLVPEADRAAVAAIGVGALVSVPLIKEGRPVAAFSAVSFSPREWTPEEVELFGETAERTWAAVERARTEEALRENDEWLGLAQRYAGSGTWEWDLRTDEIRWSDQHRDLFGFDLSGKPIKREDWWANVHPEDLPRIKEAGRRCFEEGEEWPEIEYRIFRAGELRWIAARGRTEKDGEGRAIRIRGISTDATERKEAEEERDRLLAREWVAAAEVAERERISRELHDRVAHSMGVAHQSLQLHKLLAEKDPDRAEAKLDLAGEMVKASLESTRNLSAELRHLDAEEDLETELRRLLDVAVPPSISAAVSVDGDEAAVPGHVRGQLFLVLREAVRNAVTHSGCHSISVGLDVGPGRVVGTVEDDGRGFEESEGDGGVGLRSMRERAALLDGVLELDCEPGRGTRVEISVPLTGER